MKKLFQFFSLFVDCLKTYFLSFLSCLLILLGLSPTNLRKGQNINLAFYNSGITFIMLRLFTMINKQNSAKVKTSNFKHFDILVIF